MFSLFLTDFSTHWESVHNIFATFPNLITLATKHRPYVPITMDNSSQLEMVSFFFSDFAPWFYHIFLYVRRWLQMSSFTIYENRISRWIHSPKILVDVLSRFLSDQPWFIFHVVISSLLSLLLSSFSFQDIFRHSFT